MWKGGRHIIYCLHVLRDLQMSHFFGRLGAWTRVHYLREPEGKGAFIKVWERLNIL